MTDLVAYEDFASGAQSPQVVGMTKPLPVSMRPSQYDSGGHYAIDVSTGSLAASASTRLIWYCRNTSASLLVAITELSIQGMIATTAYAAGQILFGAFMARSFTAENGTPGGTAATLTGNNQKVRTSMPTIQAMGVVRAATTAAIAAPTWTLDTQAIGEINTHSSGGWQSATPIIGSVYMPDNELYCIQPHEHPIVLAQNEGVGINLTTPGTGVGVVTVRLKWSELSAY